MRGRAVAEAQRLQQGRALPGPPLGDGQDRQVIGQQRAHRQRQDGRQREAPPLRTARVRDGGQRRQQIRRRRNAVTTVASGLAGTLHSMRALPATTDDSARERPCPGPAVRLVARPRPGRASGHTEGDGHYHRLQTVARRHRPRPPSAASTARRRCCLNRGEVGCRDVAGEWAAVLKEDAPADHARRADMHGVGHPGWSPRVPAPSGPGPAPVLAGNPVRRQELPASPTVARGCRGWASGQGAVDGDVAPTCPEVGVRASIRRPPTRASAPGRTAALGQRGATGGRRLVLTGVTVGCPRQVSNLLPSA